MSLLGPGIAALLRKTNARIATEFQHSGFASYEGAFRHGLTRWPEDGFPLLEKSPWAVQTAFDNPSAGIRCFQGTTFHGNHVHLLSGAAILVTAARYPIFSIEPARRGIIISTEPSNVTFREDPAFAEEYSIQTDKPHQLGQLLGRNFMTTWRAMPGWRLEGNGDWVIASQSHSVMGHQVADFATLLLALAAALREDIEATRIGGRAQPRIGARPT